MSSSSEDQLNSFAAQNAHYTELITANPEWEFVDVYADKGITGTSAEKRDDFQRLLADCRRGRVDKILVKSCSRFARNAKECLKAIRELNVGVYVFESGPLWEAIDQLRPNNAQGEYYLTDAPAYILSRGGRVGACPTCTAEEMLGVNTVEQLAQVEELVRRREGLK